VESGSGNRNRNHSLVIESGAVRVGESISRTGEVENQEEKGTWPTGDIKQLLLLRWDAIGFVLATRICDYYILI